MFLSNAAKPEHLENSLANAGAACRTAFEELARQLADVQNSVLALLGLFDTLVEELDSQRDGADPVAEAEKAARSLINSLPSECDDSYAHMLEVARQTLDGFSKEARALRAYASLTRLTAASLHVSGLEAYVDEVNKIAEEIGVHAKALADCVDVIGRERDPAIKAQQAAAQDLRAMLTNLAPARAAQVGLVGEDTAFRSDLASRVDGLSKGGLSEISSLISIVQFADQFAQRLEHITTILSSNADREPVMILVAAQEAALIADAEEICFSANAALDRLGQIAGRSSLITGEDIASSPLGRLLQTQRSALDCVRRCNDATAASLVAAAGAAEQIVSALDAADQKFEYLRTSAESVSIAAMNALLLPRRTGVGQIPLGVLAKAVSDSSITFRENTVVASEAISRLSKGFDPESVGSLEKGFAGFDASVRFCCDQIEAANRSASMIDDLLSKIGLAIEKVERAAINSRTVMDEVLCALRDLRSSSAPQLFGTTDPQPLESFIAIYTMEREREIHAAVTGVVLEKAEVKDDFDLELF